MIDFVQAIRHDRVAVETPDGIVMRDPPQPSFSMKGRAVQSMLRLMQHWHRRLGVANGGLTWTPTALRPLHVLTIEVDMKRRAVVQARGWGDRPAFKKALRLLEEWGGESDCGSRSSGREQACALFVHGANA
jgi:hypothetical protein